MPEQLCGVKLTLPVMGSCAAANVIFLLFFFPRRGSGIEGLAYVALTIPVRSLPETPRRWGKAVTHSDRVFGSSLYTVEVAKWLFS